MINTLNSLLNKQLLIRFLLSLPIPIILLFNIDGFHDLTDNARYLMSASAIFHNHFNGFVYPNYLYMWYMGFLYNIFGISLLYSTIIVYFIGYMLIFISTPYITDLMFSKNNIPVPKWIALVAPFIFILLYRGGYAVELISIGTLFVSILLFNKDKLLLACIIFIIACLTKEIMLMYAPFMAFLYFSGYKKEHFIKSTLYFISAMFIAIVLNKIWFYSLNDSNFHKAFYDSRIHISFIIKNLYFIGVLYYNYVSRNVLYVVILILFLFRRIIKEPFNFIDGHIKSFYTQSIEQIDNYKKYNFIVITTPTKPVTGDDCLLETHNEFCLVERGKVRRDFVAIYKKVKN